MADQPEPRETKPQDILNLAFNCASAYGACLWPFCRSSFGSRAFAGYPLSLIGMLVYAGWRECEAMGAYVIAWLVAVAYRRLTTDSNQHSLYQGYPWVFGWMATERVARLSEMFIAFPLAVYYSTIDGAMTDFFMCMIPALLLVQWVEAARDAAWKRQRRDAEVLSRHMSEL